MHRGSSRIAVLFLLLVVTCAACGGSSGGSPPPNSPDFTVSMQPQPVAVVPGGSATFTVSVTGANGFSSPVTLTFGLAPSGMTVSPGTFTLTAGSQQTVTIAGALWTPPGSVQLALSGVSGARVHDLTVTVQVGQPPFDSHSPGRTRFLRTDTVAYGGAAYDSATRRFFLSDPWANVLIVFDAVRETEIARITIPEPGSMDLSPDHRVLWVDSRAGDLYKVDPVGLKILARIPTSEIGPEGQIAYQPHELADGRVALVGGPIGLKDYEGNVQLSVWDPRTNDLQSYVATNGFRGRFPGQLICPGLFTFGAVRLSADRSRIYVADGSGGGGSTFCELAPATGSYREVTTELGDIREILPTPDGKSLIVGNTVYDAATLTRKSTFTLPDPNTGWASLLTYDGAGVYLFSEWDSRAYLYDYNTGQSKGWFSSFIVPDRFPDTVPPRAVDETGLVFGHLSHGVGFVDASLLHSGTAPTGTAWSVSPPLGPPAGGTTVSMRMDETGDFTFGSLYFGNRQASGYSKDSLNLKATAPGGSGTVDVTAFSADGWMLLAPEGFSYGPRIYEIASTHATAEGGATTSIFGYGFGPMLWTVPADLHVLVGGQPATITAFSAHFYNDSIEWPLQQIDITLPPGAAGSSVDVTVTNSIGSTTARGALTYLPAVRSYPLPGASFEQGTYDKYRDLYYFTDARAVQVFSATQGRWLAPLMTTSDPKSSLYALSISPDGSKLAVSDWATAQIHLVDLATGAVRSFAVEDPFNSDQYPAGLAVSDSGAVYFVHVGYQAPCVLRKLDTATGMFTDYRRNPVEGPAGGSERVLLSSDNRRVYLNTWYGLTMVDTASDEEYVTTYPKYTRYIYDMALSGDSTRLMAGYHLFDANLNRVSNMVADERIDEIASWWDGIKLNANGRLLFNPETYAISLYDGQLGTPVGRIPLPVTLSTVYDPLVVTGKDNVLVAITGDKADGVAVIDLNSVPEPPLFPYLSGTGPLSKTLLQTSTGGVSASGLLQPSGARALDALRTPPAGPAFRRAPRTDPRLLRGGRTR